MPSDHAAQNLRTTSIGLSMLLILRSSPSSLRIERAVEIDGRADEGEMGEGLWEVAAGLPRHRGLLGEQAQVTGVAEHALEHEPGLVEAGRVVPARARERFDQPEAADVERALVARQAVGAGERVVAVHQAVG